MGNRPEYLVIHAGLAKIVVVPALVNPHIRGQVLKHALTIVDAKAVISGPDFIGHYCEVVKETA